MVAVAGVGPDAMAAVAAMAHATRAAQKKALKLTDSIVVEEVEWYKKYRYVVSCPYPCISYFLVATVGKFENFFFIDFIIFLLP